MHTLHYYTPFISNCPSSPTVPCRTIPMDSHVSSIQPFISYWIVLHILHGTVGEDGQLDMNGCRKDTWESIGQSYLSYIYTLVNSHVSYPIRIGRSDQIMSNQFLRVSFYRLNKFPGICYFLYIYRHNIIYI